MIRWQNTETLFYQLSAFTSSQLAHRSHVGQSTAHTQGGIQASSDKQQICDTIKDLYYMHFVQGTFLFLFCVRARAFAPVSKSSYLPHPLS